MTATATTVETAVKFGSRTYPKAHWYVIASSDEVDRSLLPRTVAGEHLVLFRTEAGEVVVMDDRCSHRRYPLSAGELIGDTVQCGYHGLRFDAGGTCTWAPGQDRIPTRANVMVRPAVERSPWIFVWMGDPDAPDQNELPDVPWFDDDAWGTVSGMEPLDAPYGLLIDNLLDLSHETFLHAGFIGTPEVADTPIQTNVDDYEEVIYVSRRMEAVECPPFYRESTGLQTPIDRWQDIEYHPPGFYLLHVRVAPAGVQPEGDDEQAAHVKVLYAITPVDDDKTLDFWAVARNFALDDPEVDDFIGRMNREVVLQDVDCLNLIAERSKTDANNSEVSLKIDTGGLAGRRMLREQAERELTSGS